MNLACPACRTSSRGLASGDGTTHRSTNHFFPATCPAEVLPRIFNGDGQIIAAAILSGLGTGRALRHVIQANLTDSADVFEDSKLPPRVVNERNSFAGWQAFSVKPRGHDLSSNEAPQLFFAHFAKPVQVRDLFFQIVVCPVKPVAPVCAAMNPKRPPDRVPKLPVAQFVVLGEDFDSLG